MRIFLITVIIFLQMPFFSCQTPKISGCWSGILGDSSNNFLTYYPVVLQIQALDNKAKGTFRIEKDHQFIQFEVNGTFDKTSFIPLKSSKKPLLSSKGFTMNEFSFTLRYLDSSGYYVGNFSSSDPNLNGFKLILDKENSSINLGNTLLFDSYFGPRFLHDFSLGLSSKEKRKQELKSFVFQPIYFPYDEWSLSSNYYSYLNKVAKIVLSHSDLRIKILGNTDGDGSETYNLDLSQKRAETIKDYLIKKGISSSRIQLEFNGESKPASSNFTEEGKQKNRRVDICFI